MFQGRQLVIATMHHKEQAIAPVLEAALGVTCITDPQLNTDVLGTFSGEVERTMDPLSTAREKCLMAMRQTNCNLGVASEGSFGPHPQAFFVTCNEEFLIFIDKANDLEIVVKETSLQTNFNAQTITTYEELKHFADKAGFPEHALILSKTQHDYTQVHKGIQDWPTLLDTFAKLRELSPSVYVATDMRAMYNPSRMQVIAAAAARLVDRINSKCPACSRPGFGLVDVRKGLPCSACGVPTQSIRSHIYQCTQCAHEHEVLHPTGKSTEEPMYCDYCNP